MHKDAISESRDRVLVAADKLFMERGFKAVTLRDIADAVGIKHASLYHHAPGGKKQLFVEVIERTLNSHYVGLTAAVQTSEDLKTSLYAVADWLLAHPPMDMLRMTQSDMVEFPADEVHRIGQLVQRSLLDPLRSVIDASIARGRITPVDSGVVAGGLLSLVEGIHAIPEIAFAHELSKWYGRSRVDMARYLIDVFLNGLLPRGTSQDVLS